MKRAFRGRAWIASHADLWWDVLRIYMGVALFIKGFVLLRHTDTTLALMTSAGAPFGVPSVATAVALLHVGGGLLLTFGLFTRFAAAIQIPNVLAAILYVHLRQGLFTPGQTLELALLVLVILALIVLGGPGRYSTDYYFGRVRSASPQPA